MRHTNRRVLPATLFTLAVFGLAACQPNSVPGTAPFGTKLMEVCFDAKCGGGGSGVWEPLPLDPTPSPLSTPTPLATAIAIDPCASFSVLIAGDPCAPTAAPTPMPTAIATAIAIDPCIGFSVLVAGGPCPPTATPLPSVGPLGVTTMAGSNANAVGYADGSGATSMFSRPMGITCDASGNLYIADAFNSRIRKLTPSGGVTTLAGSSKAFADGIGTAAKFNFPHGLAVANNGTVYVADTGNNRIRAITASGTVTTLAGSSTTGSFDGSGPSAQFRAPWDVVVDRTTGNLYVSDSQNQRIRRVTPAGSVSTFATAMTDPRGMGIDSSGNLYVAEPAGGKITKFTPTGVPSTYASGLTQPWDVDCAANGDIIVSEADETGGTYRMKTITPAGVVTVVAGGTAGSDDGALGSATFSVPKSVCIANGRAYVSEYGNNRVRAVTWSGTYVQNTLEALAPTPVPTAVPTAPVVGPLTNSANAMTSNTAPANIASASTEHWPAYYAFDNNNGTQWGSAVNAGTPASLGYEFTSNKTVTNYDLTFVNGSIWQRGPRDWTLQGWNGSSWVTVDTVTNETCWGNPPGAPSGGCGPLSNHRNYVVDTPGSYIRYRLYFTKDNYMTATPTMITLGSVQFNGY
jgi:sugar lactone lactonase YvrE